MKKILFTLTIMLTTLFLIANCSGSTTNPTTNLKVANCTYEGRLEGKETTQRMICAISDDKDTLAVKDMDGRITITLKKSTGIQKELVEDKDSNSSSETTYLAGTIKETGKIWTYAQNGFPVSITVTLD